MWIKFSSDEELEGLGFRAKYSFIPGNEVIFSVGLTLVLESYVYKREFSQVNQIKVLKKLTRPEGNHSVNKPKNWK